MGRGLATTAVLITAAACAFLARPGSSWGGEPPAEGGWEAEQLIAVLEQGGFDERQAAARKLEALGEAARPALEKAFKGSAVFEVRETAERLLEYLRRAVVVLEARDRQGRPAPILDLHQLVSPLRTPPLQRCSLPPPSKAALLDDQGRVELGHFRPGPYNLAADCGSRAVLRPDSLPGDVYLHPKENRFQFVFVAGGAVKGTVYSARTGEGLANARVWLVRDDGQSWVGAEEEITQPVGVRLAQPHPLAATKANGEFCAEKVPPGTYHILAVHDAHAPLWAGPVRVRDSGEAVLPAPVRLTPKSEALGALKFRVYDAKDAPVSSGEVELVLTWLPQEEDASALRDHRARLLRSLSSVQNKPAQQTDEAGWVEQKDLLPGLYRVVVSQKDTVPVVASSVEVKAGQTTVVDGPKPGPGATLSGQISVSQGTGNVYAKLTACPLDDPLTPVLVEEGLRGRNWAASVHQQRQLPPYHLQSDKDGCYTFKRLPPGRYVLLAALQDGRVGLIFGVEAKVGKTTQVPDMVVPPVSRAARSSASGNVRQLRGVVLRPDGKPAGSAGVLFYSGQTTAYGSAGTDGRFTLNVPKSLPAGQEAVVVAMHGTEFRPVALDLNQPGLDWEKLELRLEAKAYGRLRVTVQDPAGRPLEGVAVTPHYFPAVRGPDYTRTRVTQANGATRLSGLAFGERQLDVFLDGYYLAQPVSAKVVAREETPVTVALRPGLTLKGRVALPPGLDPARVVVWLRGTSCGPFQELSRVAAVDNVGRFQFAGLPPGRVRLYPQVAGPYSGCAIAVDVAPDAPEVALPLLPDGALRVELGPAAKGATARLVPSEDGAVSAGDPQEKAQAQSTVDSQGAVEFFGLPAGRYDLLVTPRGSYREDPRHSAGVRVFPDLELAAVSEDRLRGGDLPRTHLPWAAGDAAVRGELAVHDQDGKQVDSLPYTRGAMGVKLLVASQDALGTAFLSFPMGYGSREPVLVGAAPARPPTPPRDGFLIEGLPPGDYRLYAVCQSSPPGPWNRERFGGLFGARLVIGIGGRVGRGSADPRGLKPDGPPQLLKEFSLAKGQTLDLGKVTCPLPAPWRKRAADQAKIDRLPVVLDLAEGEDEP